MSDLLAATGWIGEHPRTGADVAHLLIYPATDLDPQSAAKLAILADTLGLRSARTSGDPPLIEGGLDLDRGRLTAAGLDMAVPPLNDEWAAAVAAQGFAVVTLTSQPLAAPGLPEIEAMIYSDPAMWIGKVTAS